MAGKDGAAWRWRLRLGSLSRSDAEVAPSCFKMDGLMPYAFILLHRAGWASLLSLFPPQLCGGL